MFAQPQLRHHFVCWIIIVTIGMRMQTFACSIQRKAHKKMFLSQHDSINQKRRGFPRFGNHNKTNNQQLPSYFNVLIHLQLHALPSRFLHVHVFTPNLYAIHDKDGDKFNGQEQTGYSINTEVHHSLISLYGENDLECNFLLCYI